jgi:hypothetical protein
LGYSVAFGGDLSAFMIPMHSTEYGFYTFVHMRARAMERITERQCDTERDAWMDDVVFGSTTWQNLFSVTC